MTEESGEVKESETVKRKPNQSTYRTVAYATSILFLANLAFLVLFYRGTASFFRGELIDAEIRITLYLLIALFLSIFIYKGDYNALKVLILFLAIVLIASFLLLDTPALIIAILLSALIYFNWSKLRSGE